MGQHIGEVVRKELRWKEGWWVGWIDLGDVVSQKYGCSGH